jgi:hypothetical protein
MTRPLGTLRPFPIWVVLTLVLAGCDRGPGGPWEAVLTLESAAGTPAPAAMVVFLAGSGVLEIHGDPDTRVWWELAPAEGGVRVVAVRLPDTGTPALRVRLDVGVQTPPTATLLALAGTDNARLLPSEAHRLRWSASR